VQHKNWQALVKELWPKKGRVKERKKKGHGRFS
jgi:hypothetical protein